MKFNKSKILPFLPLGYPLLTHIAIWQNKLELALLILGIIAGLFLISRSKQPNKNSAVLFEFALWTGLIIISVCIVQIGATKVTLYLPPILLISFFLINFGKTLLPGKEPLITKIARVVFQDDGPETAAYTRRVTWLWTCFLGIILVQTIGLSLFAPIEIWSLFTNVLNYLFMCLLFIIEYIYRQVRFGYRHSLFYYLRGLSRFPLKQLFKS
jgi:uncharacterized membrane protein